MLDPSIRYPACKPYLPKADALLPYLQEIDHNRFYTNFAPLLIRFIERLSALMHIDPSHLVTASSGMTALEQAIAALHIPRGGLALCPAFTFIATPMAALNNGLKPYFADVELDSWALTPAIAEAALAKAPAPASLVIPVAPFGLKPDMKGWEDFSARHNIPVIIDGAAMNFEEVEPSPTVPVMVSLHATKLLNAGEGGFIVCKNADYIEEIRGRTAFGLFHKDGVSYPATNAKLNEYQVAVGLAALDLWPETKKIFTEITRLYAKNLKSNPNMNTLIGLGEGWFTCFMPVWGDALNMERLTAHKIGTRAWWRKGCHIEPLFKDAPRLPLPNTERITPIYTGLPCYRDMPLEAIDEICDLLN